MTVDERPGRPASDDAPAPDAPPDAKPFRAEHRRRLPHLQIENTPTFVTFATWKRWLLPPSVRSLVLEHCVHDNGTKHHLHGAVVMPDHVHLVLTPLADARGVVYGLPEILGGIKGASAHRVNRALNRRGRVWQVESFDRVLRSEESVEQKVEYICQNPVRAGFVSAGDEYPWLWREWIEGAAR